MIELGKAGWLQTCLKDVVKHHRDGELCPAAFAEAERLVSPAARARRYLRLMLRESGLIYGTPVRGEARAEVGGREEVLFTAVVRTLAHLALDLARLAEAAPGPRPEQLLLLYATLTGRLDDAEDVHRRIERAWEAWPLPSRLWRDVEEALEARAVSLTADPSYGLVLHNGALYADANLFGRVAIAYFVRSTYPRPAAERRVRFSAVQKATLVEVLVGLSCAERRPGLPTRRAILRQIDDLALPEDLAEATRAFAREAFERPVPLKRLAAGVRSQDMRRFILEQTVLAALVDGRRSEAEVAWTRSLGAHLGFSRGEVAAVELAMADFYRVNRDVVDVFTVAAAAEGVGDEWLDTIEAAVRKNSRAVLNEIRKTGELSVLLGRLARGQTLSDDEKRRMRAQLLDVARAVPALAIFAAPGGGLLLLALAKVLPFNILPSSFQEPPGAEPEDQPSDGPAG